MKWIKDTASTNERFRPKDNRRPILSPPRLKLLEDRVLLNNDLLIWNPGQGDGTLLASHAANWWDSSANGGLGQQGVEAAGIRNGVGCQVLLQSTKSTAEIT